MNFYFGLPEKIGTPPPLHFSHSPEWATDLQNLDIPGEDIHDLYVDIFRSFAGGGGTPVRSQVRVHPSPGPGLGNHLLAEFCVYFWSLFHS